MAETEYAAFISYRHTEPDKTWAKWLLNELETYRVPKKLVTEGFPTRVGKAYRDEDEFAAASDLSEHIKDALRRSRHMIVVCSKNTPDSNWVGQEIEYFREIGKGDKILALLVDGEPETSFPNELAMEKENGEMVLPAAADVRPTTQTKSKVTNDLALMRLVASIIGCSFDDLAQRERERQRKKQQTRMSVLATLIGVLTLSSLYWWDYTREKTQYFNTYSNIYGVPIGIGKISESRATGTNAVFAIYSQRRKVVRMERLTGAEKLYEFDENSAREPWLEGIAKWEYVYRGDGTLDHINLSNEKSQSKLTLDYDFNPNLQSAQINFTNRDIGGDSSISIAPTSIGIGGDRKSEITQHRLRFTPDGLIASREFETLWGVRTQDANGVSGLWYDYDDEKRVVRTGQLDGDNNPMPLNSGIHITAYAYDRYSRTTETFFTDREGNPILTNEGYAKTTAVFDARGNLIKAAYLGVNGEPVLSKDGIAKSTFNYDVRGNLIEEAFFGVEGEPTIYKPGGFSKLLAEHDDQHNVISIAVFDPDGKPTISTLGASRIEQKYDERGNRIEVRFLGLDGEPVLQKDDYAKVTSVYDARGRITQEAYFGVGGEPVLHKDGYAKFTSAYDARGNLTELNYFGMDGEPVLNKEGTAKLTFVYDDRGNRIEQAYFGVDGEPVLHKDGYAKFTSAYDARGNLIEQASFGIEGRAVLSRDGYAGYTAVYDARGNTTEVAYFGAEGEPVLNKDGYAGYTADYDRRSNRTELMYFGLKGEPVLNKDGYAGYTADYDRRSNRTELMYFGLKGEPILSVEGIAKITNVYDAQGNSIEQAYFGVEDEPVLSNVGVAKRTAVYNARGNRIEEAYFGVDGEPVLHRAGYAKLTSVYDARGNLTERAFFGVDGEPVLHRAGYAKLTSVHDARGNLTESAFFGVDGEPISLKDGYAKYTSVYDARGNLTEIAFFGVDGEPVLHKDGLAKFTADYDDRGNRINAKYFDNQGLRNSNVYRHSGYKIKYNDLNQLIEITYVGTNDEPTGRRNTRNADGERLENTLGEWQSAILNGIFTSEEIMSIQSGTFTSAKQRFDASGQLTQINFYDETGAPAVGFDGFTEVRVTYDPRGLPILYTGKRSSSDEVSFALEYSDRRDLTKIAFLDGAGNPTTSRLGFAELYFDYDVRYEIIGRRYFDAEGNLVGED